MSSACSGNHSSHAGRTHKRQDHRLRKRARRHRDTADHPDVRWSSTRLCAEDRALPGSGAGEARARGECGMIALLAERGPDVALREPSTRREPCRAARAGPVRAPRRRVATWRRCVRAPRRGVATPRGARSAPELPPEAPARGGERRNCLRKGGRVRGGSGETGRRKARRAWSRDRNSSRKGEGGVGQVRGRWGARCRREWRRRDSSHHVEPEPLWSRARLRTGPRGHRGHRGRRRAQRTEETRKF